MKRNSFARIVSLMLTLVLVCGCFAITGSAKAVDMPFTDVAADSWYYEDVAEVYKNGIMIGLDEDTFGPEETTTRAMLVTVLYRLDGSDYTGQSKFIDVPADAYYADAVAWARENKIVFGVNHRQFAPDLGITRQQFITILFRYAIYSGRDMETDLDILKEFEDVSEIDGYAFPAMAWAVEQDLIKGFPGNLLIPNGTTTRAQAAAFLNRFLDELM